MLRRQSERDVSTVTFKSKLAGSVRDERIALRTTLGTNCVA